MRGRPAPNLPLWPSVLCSRLIAVSWFFHSTPKGGFANM